MSAVTGMLSAVFWGLVVISILVSVHEGGHFVMARAFGMRVTEFFLGLPCRYRLSWKSKKLGTEFGITPILLGGYNNITGMEGDVHNPLLPKALALVQRDGRIAAADVARELGIEEEQAYSLLATLVGMASIRPYYDESLGEHSWQSDWPQSFETLARDGEMRTEYDRNHDFAMEGSTQAGQARPVDDAQAFFEHEANCTYMGKNFIQRFLTLVMGPTINIVFSIALLVGSLMIIGVEINANSNTLGGVVDDSPAQLAGLQEGDQVIQLGGQDVSDWVTLCTAISDSLDAGGDISVAYIRDDQTFETTVVIPEGEKVETIGVNALMETYHPGIGEASSFALSYLQLVGGTVMRLLMPQHTIEIVSQSSSIVGVSAMASEAAATGFNSFLLFMAAISMSLGFMNLLPIPPLDGGKIVLEVVQLAIRRPLPKKAQNAVSYVGLAFFLFLFAFALKNDISRLLGFS